MSIITITPTLPALLEIGDERASEISTIADDMLLSAVRSEKIAKVPAGSPNQARAWSAIGNVD